MRRLGKVQKDVLAMLKRHGYWHRGPGCGWTWTGVRATERILDSLVRAGRVDVFQERRVTGGQIVFVYRPVLVIPVISTVVLSDGSAIDGSSPLAMLERQYRILMRLSRQYKNDERVQKAISDANMLGLEVVDRLNELKEK